MGLTSREIRVLALWIQEQVFYRKIPPWDGVVDDKS